MHDHHYPSVFVNAVKENDIGQVKKILKRGKIKLNVTDSCLSVMWYDSTPLVYTSSKGYLSIVRLLLRCDVDVNKKDKASQTPLNLAAHNGHTDIVHALLDAHADVNEGDMGGRRPLYWAAENGHTDIVRVLLDANADVKEGDVYGRTPLLRAAKKGRTDTVRVLLDAHANINSADIFNLTPIHWAARNGHSRTVHVLIGANADIDNCSKGNPLHWAAGNGHTDIVCILIDANADVNRRDSKGWTPLHWATRNGHTDTVKQLLEHGADFTLVSWCQNMTALQIAESKDFADIVDILQYYTTKKASVPLLPHIVKRTREGMQLMETPMETKDEQTTDDSFANPDHEFTSDSYKPTDYHIVTSRMLLKRDSTEVILPKFTLHRENNDQTKLSGVRFKRVADINQEVDLPLDLLDDRVQLTSTTLMEIAGRPTEKELSHLTVQIGFEWVLLAAQLDISRYVTQQIEMTHRDAKNQIFEMLVHWRLKAQSCSEDDRLEKLKTALRSSPVGRNDLANLL